MPGEKENNTLSHGVKQNSKDHFNTIPRKSDHGNFNTTTFPFDETRLDAVRGLI